VKATAVTADANLRSAALLFLVGFLLHNADHFRRGVETLPPGVFWAGSISGVITLAAIALTLLGYRESPAIGFAIGFGMAIGVSMVHLLPPWGPLSDSLAAASADLFTWLAVLSEVAGALVFGWAGLRLLSKQRVEEVQHPSW